MKKTFDEIFSYFVEMEEKLDNFDVARDYLSGVACHNISFWSESIEQAELSAEENKSLVKLMSIIQKKLKDAANLQNHAVASQNEIDKIRRGYYHAQLHSFTYNLGLFLDKPEYTTSFCGEKFKVYPLINRKGFRCTAAIQASPLEEYEIHINFFGTIDFASMVTDFDFGGPGQEAIRRYEHHLLQSINHIVRELKEIRPYVTIRLRLAGHSLGGALAKGLAFTLLRALAIQNDSAEEITQKIMQELYDSENPIPKKQLQTLKSQLKQDEIKFADCTDLSAIKGITLYAVGSPGISRITDWHSTLLTYYHSPEFLKVYNHYHEEDIVLKFGDSEFLSGKWLAPRILVNKAIEYKIPIDKDEIERAKLLPFPKITKRGMAAHGINAFYASEIFSTKIREAVESDYLQEKFEFSVVKRACYRQAFSFLSFLSSSKTITKYTLSLESISESFPDFPKLTVHDFFSIDIPHSKPISIKSAAHSYESKELEGARMRLENGG